MVLEAVLTSTHNLCFEQKKKKKSEFLEMKFSIYLYKRVFVIVFVPPGQAKEMNIITDLCIRFAAFNNGIRWYFIHLYSCFIEGRRVPPY